MSFTHSFRRGTHWNYLVHSTFTAVPEFIVGTTLYHGEITYADYSCSLLLIYEFIVSPTTTKASPDLITRLAATGVFERSLHKAPNHVIINEYKPGDGIMVRTQSSSRSHDNYGT